MVKWHPQTLVYLGWHGETVFDLYRRGASPRGLDVIKTVLRVEDANQVAIRLDELRKSGDLGKIRCDRFSPINFPKLLSLETWHGRVPPA